MKYFLGLFFLLSFTVNLNAQVSTLDTDNDGIPDYLDLDDDNDGILDTLECNKNIFTTGDSGTFGQGTATYGIKITENTDYPFREGGSFGGTYSIIKNTDVVDYSVDVFRTLKDRTNPDNGYFAYFDMGINDRGKALFTQTINVPAGESCRISFWMAGPYYDRDIFGNLLNNSTGKIGIKIDGVLLQTVTVADDSDWNYYSYDFISTGNTALLEFINNSTGGTIGSDVAFDDINIQLLNCSTDTDGDGIVDSLDLDSDNDGIPDSVESHDNNFIFNSTVDSNGNGVIDIFESMQVPVDSDNDGIPDYLDLDSDNDGILDSTETTTDTDADGIPNYRDLDSDNDVCYDVVEAGFMDSNGDGMLGAITPPPVDTNGLVTSGTAYTTPNSNYITAAPILITTQPLLPPICDLKNTSISIVANGDSYQWQLSTNGTTWNNLTNNSIYSGTSSNNLNINSVNQMMNGYKYRVFINRIGNSCGLISNEITLLILNSPVVNSITIKQCDDDLDARTTFNLTEKNNEISNNYTEETFSYFTTLAAANTNDLTQKITNPLTYVANNGTTIWTRVENANACFSVAQINLVVSTTQIPANFNILFENCDDYIDAANDDYDGISAFDFSSAQNTILALLPLPTSNYSVKYYATQADALSETNEIINTTSYRNTLSSNEQKIWVRVDNDSDNSCFGIGEHITLRVNPKPNIDINSNHLADVYVCENLADFYVTLDSGILDGSPTTDYSYVWSKDNQVLTSHTNATLTVNAAGIYTVTVTSQYGCSRTRTITVTASNIAQITNVEVNELSNSNTILIIVEGVGNYEYSLDDPTGSYQDANLFENVPAGIHEIYVRDKNGCGITNESIAILGAPKFFTPNNDGFNDYWNIKGINTEFNSKTVIRIFDRYGKLIKNINPQGQGWDGTFNGHPLPSDDYWYTTKFENGKEIKGHFSLKR